MTRALEPSYRFRAGMILGLNYTANASPSFMRGVVGVKYDDGLTEEFILMATSLTTTRATFVIYPGTQQTLAPTQTFFKPGYVEYAQVVQGGATKIAQRGQLYCSLVIADLASFESHTLCADYLFTGNSLTLGIVVPPGPAGGHGMKQQLGTAQPAAGADYAASTLAAGQLIIMRGLHCQLVAAVAAGNREFVIQWTDTTGGTISGGAVADEVVVSGVTSDFYGVSGSTSSGVSSGVGTGAIQIGLGNHIIPPGGQIIPKTFNIQAADQWTGSLTYDVEEWVMPS